MSSCHLSPDEWANPVTWNREAARVQAERAMRAEEKVDTLISMLACANRENTELRDRVKELEEELRELGVRL